MLKAYAWLTKPSERRVPPVKATGGASRWRVVVMGNTVRGQRVKVMRAVFGGLALLCLAGWLFVRSAGSTAEREARAAAEARTGVYATSTVARVTTVDGARLVIEPKSFAEAVQREVSSDATVARVRVWDSSGALAASTDPEDRAGKGIHAGDGLRAALRGETGSTDTQATFTPLGGGSASTQTLTQTFVPLSLRAGAKPVGAVEVDFLRSALVSPWWGALSIALVAAAAIFGVFVVFMARAARPATGPIKKVEPLPTAATIRHDYRAATRRADRGWVAPANDSPPPATSVEELESAIARVAELEDALQRASRENAQVRSHAASQEQDIERLRQEASERVAELEEQVRSDGPEIETLRAKLSEAQSRAVEAESLLTTAREELAAAHTQVGDTRVSEDGEGEVASLQPAEPELGPAEPEPTDPTDLIAVLEAKVAEAEARAQTAKDEAMQLSPEASDLRTRLARTAARKKMGSAG
jgi:hypothetical protein